MLLCLTRLLLLVAGVYFSIGLFYTQRTGYIDMRQVGLAALRPLPEAGDSLTDTVLRLNKQRSGEFCSPAMRRWRAEYRLKHPTEICVLKCMDGRLHLPVITGTPHGVIQPFRNIGGRFDLGWPYFAELMVEFVEYALKKKRHCLTIITYHYSHGSAGRGCRGFNHDTDSARVAAFELWKRFELIYGGKDRVMHAIVVGIETDEDALIFHGEDQRSTLQVAQSLHLNESDIRQQLLALYPSMREQVLEDILPLVQGNQGHVREVRLNGRLPIELDHSEHIIAVGRGFSWLHCPNLALIIGPYADQWPDAVEAAGNIVLDNINAGRTPSRQALLLVSAFSRHPIGGYGWRSAIEKAVYLEQTARKVLQERIPALHERLEVLCGVLDASTQLLHPIS